MQIALIMESMDAGRGGAETSAGQFIDHLIEQGVGVVAITRSAFPERDGLTVRTIETSGGRYARTRRFLREARRVATSCGADLVHAITPIDVADVYEPRSGTVAETIARNVAMRPTALARLLKRVTGRCNLREQLLLTEERRLLSRLPRPHVIAISEYVKRQLRQHHDVGGENVSVVFNGVDAIPIDGGVTARAEAIRARYQLDDCGRLVLVVANNFRLKGVPQAIRSLAKLNATRNGRAILVVVGRDNPRTAVGLARQLGVHENVHVAGPVEDMPAMYAAADVLLHPTWYDPCSRVVLEALTAGLPCITTRFNGAAEAITRPEQGVVVDSPSDVEAIRVALAPILDRPRSPRRAPPDAAEAVSMARHADGVIKVYRRLLAAKGRP